MIGRHTPHTVDPQLLPHPHCHPIPRFHPRTPNQGEGRATTTHSLHPHANRRHSTASAQRRAGASPVTIRSPPDQPLHTATQPHAAHRIDDRTKTHRGEGKHTPTSSPSRQSTRTSPRAKRTQPHATQHTQHNTTTTQLSKDRRSRDTAHTTPPTRGGGVRSGHHGSSSTAGGVTPSTPTPSTADTSMEGETDTMTTKASRVMGSYERRTVRRAAHRDCR